MEEQDLVQFVKTDKKSIIDAFLYCIFDSEYLSIEDVLDQIDFTKTTYSEPKLNFKHEESVYH